MSRRRRPLHHKRKATPLVLGPDLRAMPGWSNDKKKDPVRPQILNLGGVQGTNFTNEPVDPFFATSSNSKPLQSIDSRYILSQEDAAGAAPKLPSRTDEKTNIEQQPRTGKFPRNLPDQRKRDGLERTARVKQLRKDSKLGLAGTSHEGLRKELTEIKKVNVTLRKKISNLESIIDGQDQKEQVLEEKLKELESTMLDVVGSKLELVDAAGKAMSELRHQLKRCELCNAEIENNMGDDMSQYLV